MNIVIEDTIKPETELEKEIIKDVEFVNGALWGKPRHGHPEGLVIYHVGEVLKNIDMYSKSPDDRIKLRFIALIHDTFKYKVNRDKPKHGENHHAMIARRFAEKYTTDTDLLDIIELHDEAYNAWRKNNTERAKNLITRLGNSIDLYLAFYRCDNETGDKTSDNFKWFESLV